MRAFIFTMILFLLVGCKTKYVPVTYKETETVELHDTLYRVELKYYHDSIVTKDTLSFLSNEYAYSWASISNGYLSHSLGIIPHVTIEFPVTDYKVITKTKEVPTIQEVEVEKKLTFWQKVKLKTWSFLLIMDAVLIFAVVFLIRINNKQTS